MSALLDRVRAGVRVDARGVFVPGGGDRLFDVHFDGRRIWSFWSGRDGRATLRGAYAAWPKRLLPYLVGSSRIRVTESATETVRFEAEVAFTRDPRRVAVVNDDGVELSFDKSLRLVGTFETRGTERREPLINAIASAIEALRTAGVQPFLAYGTALGAIRDGALIGHDSDADLGYVSTHEHPVDVVRESFALQRSLLGMGFRITRYSGAAFKMHVPEGDGVERGLDVFGGYFREGRLHLMGEICTPYEQDWIYPLGTAELEGRTFPVPRDTDRFLQATYGPGWATPDPAFKFTTPESTIRLFNGLFRGSRVGRGGWDRYYSKLRRLPFRDPSDLARHVIASEPDAGSFVDIGCGRGEDVRAFVASAPHVHAMGLDFQTRSYQPMAAELESDPSTAGRAGFWHYNLLETRTWLPLSALAARLPGRRVLMARHLLDTIDRRARANLFRSCALMLRGQDEGRLYLEFCCRRGRHGFAREFRLQRRRVPQMRRELRRSGARILSEERYHVSDASGSAKICRMVVTWDRGGVQ